MLTFLKQNVAFYAPTSFIFTLSISEGYRLICYLLLHSEEIVRWQIQEKGACIIQEVYLLYSTVFSKWASILCETSARVQIPFFVKHEYFIQLSSSVQFN